MSVKQASVQSEELPWGLLPESWPLLVKEDWQNKTNGINEVAEVANEANVTANNEAQTNANQDKAIELNRSNISEVDGKVSRLTSVVSKNTSNISTNTKGIADNATGIAYNKQTGIDNADNLLAHEQSNSAHGVAGNNVGTEDYAQELIGGVVLTASALGELATSFNPVAVAPATYDQAHIQSMVDAINSLGSKQGDIITLLNQVITTQVAAKQRVNYASVGGN
ncbi:hypothetical protein NVP1091O_11 [Vibrio phage 1.091.O._10N.286.52.B12]|nr:hypothetical protein NVP1091O_11 [Vibrio phage 1.091.O._10N.286.52.B12]